MSPGATRESCSGTLLADVLMVEIYHNSDAIDLSLSEIVFYGRTSNGPLALFGEV